MNDVKWMQGGYGGVVVVPDYKYLPGSEFLTGHLPGSEWCPTTSTYPGVSFLLVTYPGASKNTGQVEYLQSCVNIWGLA